MQIEEAITLLVPSRPALAEKKYWADLGCGTGLFTKALAQLLDPGSTIFCVDTNLASLQQIPDQYHEQVLEKLQGDFVTQVFPFKKLNGILMANSLHFVKEKPSFLQQLKKYMHEDHCFLIIEYDTDKPNRWVPYPISFYSLSGLIADGDKYAIVKLSERNSVYNNGRIYSALIKKVSV